VVDDYRPVRTRALGLVLLMSAACELTPRPAPTREPPPAGSANGSAAGAAAGAAGGSAVAPPAAPPAPPPAPPAPVHPEVTEACLTTAVHVVELLIAGEPTPEARAGREQQRTVLVRRTAEVCSENHWSEAARGCVVAATKLADVSACERTFLAPPAAKP
jgi:hypothetical protein